MSPDLITPPANTHAEAAASLLAESQEALKQDGAAGAALAATKAAMAQVHATLAAAEETRAAAYDTRTAAYVTYYAALPKNGRSEQQHAAQVDKLICTRLGFIPGEANE